ncbi:helix-turn-helix domain-containing protein [Citricoccus nitrophenolicus]|uniref:Helix-turn-helix domain-containing protein n=1 Tax=Citricoccus nitrophenolicus TaxID=863575 RepID=A0ABV0IEL3_9MICC
MPTILLTVIQAAERLNEHPDTTRARLRSGELKGTRFSKRGPWRVTERAIDHFIQKGTR